MYGINGISLTNVLGVPKSLYRCVKTFKGAKYIKYIKISKKIV